MSKYVSTAVRRQLYLIANLKSPLECLEDIWKYDAFP